MESTIFCPFCGKKIAQGNAFCPFCGKELKAASAIDPTKVLAEQSAETENKLIPICKELVFAGIFSEAIYLFESMANPLPFFFNYRGGVLGWDYPTETERENIAASFI